MNGNAHVWGFGLGAYGCTVPLNAEPLYNRPRVLAENAGLACRVLEFTVSVCGHDAVGYDGCKEGSPCHSSSTS